MSDGLQEMLDRVKRVTIDPVAIAAFTREQQFVSLSFDLLIEAGSYVAVAASIRSFDPPRMNRNQAIIGGHIARLYKLISALLDQTAQHREEIAAIVTRLAFETIVNVRFLIKNASPELFDSYVLYSLKHEKKLHDDIKSNVAARGGIELPIERRMLNSVERASRRSGFDIEKISAKDPKNWGNKNIFEKAKDLGLDRAYLAAFGGGSHNVHGNWQDLLSYHLDVNDDGFLPNIEWHPARPQRLSAIALLATDAVEDYFGYIADDQWQEALRARLEDFRTRLQALDRAHEDFLSNRQMGKKATT